MSLFLLFENTHVNCLWCETKHTHTHTTLFVSAQSSLWEKRDARVTHPGFGQIQHQNGSGQLVQANFPSFGELSVWYFVKCSVIVRQPKSSDQPRSTHTLIGRSDHKNTTNKQIVYACWQRARHRTVNDI